MNFLTIHTHSQINKFFVLQDYTFYYSVILISNIKDAPPVIFLIECLHSTEKFFMEPDSLCYSAVN